MPEPSAALPETRGRSSGVAWWVARLAGFGGVVDLPRDRARPPVQGGLRVEARRDVPAELAGAVRRMAADLGVGPRMPLLAAFAVLLRRLTGDADLVIGVPGPVGVLPVRLLAADDTDFASLVRAAHAAVSEAMDHHDVPVERIAEILRLPRDLSRAPLVQVVFGDDAGHPYDLVLRVDEHDDGTLALGTIHDPELYDTARVEALLASLVTLLSGLLARPAGPTAAVTARPEGAGRLPDPVAALDPVPAPGPIGLVEKVRRWAALRPEAVAVRGHSRTLTYAQLDRLRACVTAAVRAAGARPGDAVGVLADRTDLLPGILLGVLGSGARWLLLDPAQPPARLARQAAAAGVQVLLPCPGVPVPAELAALIRAPGGEQGPGPIMPPERRGYLMATSGTTGEPAIVVNKEGPLDRFLHWYTGRFRIGPADATAMLAGLAHDALLRDVFAPLTVGGRVHIPHPALLRDPEGLAAWLAAEEVTVLHSTPQLARLLTRAGGELPWLRLVVLAGDGLTDADVRELAAMAPRAAIVNGYGATETPQVHAYAVMSLCAEAGTGHEGGPHPAPVGHGVPGSRLLIAGPGGTPAAVGELGEVLIRSVNLADGYLDPAVRPGRFDGNPFTDDPGDRIYRTGDLGRYDADGAVVLAGRADDQVKVRGHRVELGEVRLALCAHPDVASAAVVARADATGEVGLIGYAVPRHAGVSARSIRESLAARLPEYARPAALILVPGLPLTPNGKVDVAALPGPPAGGAAEPITPTERLISGVWREVLGLPRIGVTDNFFEIGGHSMSIVAVHAKLAGQAEGGLHLVDLFRFPTVRTLAAHLDGARHGLGADRAARRLAARGRRSSRPGARAINQGDS
ncbi:AMP-binding protein [Streptosporangiaceae bacterium NEAU-GS5]|nr:AMP-binding protein [Streptosporangiaceae bacterium NEAU-GS5]